MVNLLNIFKRDWKTMYYCLSKPFVTKDKSEGQWKSRLSNKPDYSRITVVHGPFQY